MCIRKHATLQGVIVGGKDVLEEVTAFYKKSKVEPYIGKVF